MLATLGILLALPPLMYFVFQRSEQSLRDWLDADLDSDMELLELINSDEFSQSHVGTYLHSLRERFRGEVVADMLCYMRLHVELALRAKGVLLMRESGLDAPVDDETREKLAEMQYLERSIGRTGPARRAAGAADDEQGPLADLHAGPVTGRAAQRDAILALASSAAQRS